MKTVICSKYGDLRNKDPEKRGVVETVDWPEVQITHDETVKIKVAYCAICGSDPHNVAGAFNRPLPQGLGHEISGVIVEVGKKATKKGLKVGDRVAGNFVKPCGSCEDCLNKQEQFCKFKGEFKCPGMAEYITWHESQVYKLPDNISLRQGCLLEPLSVAVRAADKTNIQIGDRVAICGGGPIGILVLQLMKMYGATALTLIEPVAARRDTALELGAEHVIDPINEDVVAAAMEFTNNRGYDIVIDCSGSPAGVTVLPEIAACGGKIVFSAMYPNDYDLPIRMADVFYHKELTMTGQLMSPYAFPRAARLLPYMNLEPLCQKYFYIDQAAEAFDAHMTGKYHKVLILCNKDLENL